jgi:hypothetical protein
MSALLPQACPSPTLSLCSQKTYHPSPGLLCLGCRGDPLALSVPVGWRMWCYLRDRALGWKPNALPLVPGHFPVVGLRVPSANSCLSQLRSWGPKEGSEGRWGPLLSPASGNSSHRVS